MRRAFLFVVIVSGAGCIELPDFPSASLVDGPRVLALVADPPEVTRGASLKLSLLLAGAEEYEVSWRGCITFDPLFGGQQYGEMSEDDCSGLSALLRGAGDTFEIPGELLQPIFDDPRLTEPALGGALPAELVQQIRSSVGIPVLVEATITTPDRKLRAVKRILLSENTEPHHNPPPPAFTFDTTDVRADGQTPWSCAPIDTELLTVPPGSNTEIAPATVDGTEAWTEPYSVITAQGELQERTERAFYSWFTTGGTFDRRLTRSPLRNQIWTSPKQPGCYRMWLIVRDGHGGESACGWNVGVGDREEWPDDLRCSTRH